MSFLCRQWRVNGISNNSANDYLLTISYTSHFPDNINYSLPSSAFLSGNDNIINAVPSSLLSNSSNASLLCPQQQYVIPGRRQELSSTRDMNPLHALSHCNILLSNSNDNTEVITSKVRANSSLLEQLTQQQLQQKEQQR